MEGLLSTGHTPSSLAGNSEYLLKLHFAYLNGLSDDHKRIGHFHILFWGNLNKWQFQTDLKHKLPLYFPTQKKL